MGIFHSYNLYIRILVLVGHLKPCILFCNILLCVCDVYTHQYPLNKNGRQDGLFPFRLSCKTWVIGYVIMNVCLLYVYQNTRGATVTGCAPVMSFC